MNNNYVVYKSKEIIPPGPIKTKMINPMSIEWDINYHLIRYNEEVKIGFPFGIKFHLIQLIKCMSIKLIRDHCE